MIINNVNVNKTHVCRFNVCVRKCLYNFIVFEIMIVFDYMCGAIGSVTGFGDHATDLGDQIDIVMCFGGRATGLGDQIDAVMCFGGRATGLDD